MLSFRKFLLPKLIKISQGEDPPPPPPTGSEVPIVHPEIAKRKVPDEEVKDENDMADNPVGEKPEEPPAAMAKVSAPMAPASAPLPPVPPKFKSPQPLPKLASTEVPVPEVEEADGRTRPRTPEPAPKACQNCATPLAP